MNPDRATPTDCSFSQLQSTKIVGPLSNAEAGPHRNKVEIRAIIFQN